LSESKIPLLLEYRKIRDLLSGEKTCLELKSSGKGIISWTTRGQLGIDSRIKASTGFQSYGYEQKELVSKFISVLSSEDKYFEYIQNSLRGAVDIFKKGGHVTMVYRDQIFRLFYDNRREIIETDGCDSNDQSKTLLDSKPLGHVDACRKLRFISKVHRSTPYNRHQSAGKVVSNKYKNNLEIAVRTFLKGYLHLEPYFDLDAPNPKFKCYNDLIDFIKAYKPASRLSLSRQSISNLKNRKIMIKPVMRTPEAEEFVKYLKIEFASFNETKFFKR
jgi:hypothetical protein